MAVIKCSSSNSSSSSSSSTSHTGYEQLGMLMLGLSWVRVRVWDIFFFTDEILVSSLVKTYLLLLLLPAMLPHVMERPERCRHTSVTTVLLLLHRSFFGKLCFHLTICAFTVFHITQVTPQESLKTFGII